MEKTDKAAGRLQQEKRHWILHGGLILTHAKYFLGRALLSKISPKCDFHFYPPDARNRDDENLFGAFKHGSGCIAQAIRHDDKALRPTNRFHPPAPASRQGCGDP